MILFSGASSPARSGGLEEEGLSSNYTSSDNSESGTSSEEDELHTPEQLFPLDAGI